MALCYASVIKKFVNAIFQSIFHKFLYRFTQNLLKCKSTFIISFVHFLQELIVTDNSKVE